MIFSFLAIFQVLQWTFLNFPPFSVFLAIFHVLKCVFIIFRDFQFSRHIPGPTVCISHFSSFSVISSFSSRQVDVTHFHDFQFSCLQWTFLNFPPFAVFLAIFHVLKCYFSFSVIFSFLAIFQVLQCAFLIFHVF